MTKPCIVCGGKPIIKYYAIPEVKCPEIWDYEEDGFEPMIKTKFLECETCEARTIHPALTLDAAIDQWNNGNVFQYISNEPLG